LKKHNFDASQTPDGANANNDSESRQFKLKQLYTGSYSILYEAAYDRFPELLPWDFDAAMAQVFKLLPTYGGPPDGASFERWAKRKIVDESSRWVFMHLAMTTTYRLMILSTISKNMWTSVEDCSIDAEDLYSDILPLIFRMAPKFLRNKRAKLSTRFCALAKRHVYYYHNSKNTKRLKAVTRRVVEQDKPLSVECLSALEMASIKNDEISNGYAEAGLSLA
jgi:hypothetical protein